MNSVIDFFFYSSLPFSIFGIVLFIAFSYWQNKRVSAFATIFSLISFILLTMVIAVLLVQKGVDIALVPQTRYIILAWIVMIAYFIAGYKYRIRLLGPLLMPMALVLMLIAMFVQDATITHSSDYSKVVFLRGLHMLGVLGCFALLFLSTAGAILFLIKRRALKDHQNLAIESKLPALTTLQNLMSNTFSLGFPLLTIGVILGIFVIDKNIHPNWLTDKKLLFGWLIWAIYSALFLLLKSAKIPIQKFAYSVITLFIIFTGYYICTKDRAGDASHTVDIESHEKESPGL